MEKKIENATIAYMITKVVQIGYDCPYCDHEHEIDIGKFHSDTNTKYGEYNETELKCEECGKEIWIEFTNWD